MEDERATRLIPNLGPQHIEEDKKAIRKIFLRKKPQPAGTHLGNPFYILGDLGVGYVVMFHENEIAYFLKFKRIRYNGFRLGRQVLVWRDKSISGVTDGFAQRIFFRVLLPKYTALIADKLQTQFGRNFWANAIDRAHSQGLYVYLLDRRAKKSVLTRITTEEQLEESRSLLWGTTKAHELTFAVISKRPLVLSDNQSKE